MGLCAIACSHLLPTPTLSVVSSPHLQTCAEGSHSKASPYFLLYEPIQHQPLQRLSPDAVSFLISHFFAHSILNLAFKTPLKLPFPSCPIGWAPFCTLRPWPGCQIPFTSVCSLSWTVLRRGTSVLSGFLLSFGCSLDSSLYWVLWLFRLSSQIAFIFPGFRHLCAESALVCGLNHKFAH